MKKNRIPDEQLKQIRKVLIIQLGPIGDALLTTGYFKALKEYLPGIKLHYLIKQQYVKAIAHHPLIDKIIPIPKGRGLAYYKGRWKAIKEVRSEKYDLVIDQQNMPASQFLTALSNARFRLGYNDGRFSIAYNLRALRGEKRYSAQYKFDLLVPLGMAEQKADLYFHLDASSENYIDQWLSQNGLKRGAFVCISPSSPVPRKKWKLQNYAHLADRIVSELKMPVVLLWAPGEEDDVNGVRELMAQPALMAPKTSLAEAAAMIRRAGLLLCNDGGLNHLAAAVGARTLAFFGSTDPVVWSPAPVYESHFHLYNPQHNSFEDYGFGISPEQAFGKVSSILQKKPPVEFE